jgi:IMP dehydrogenase/GMP reductase
MLIREKNKNLEFCKELKKNGVNNIISGNVVTNDAVSSYMSIGIKHIKVGIGGGSVCTTRLVTGCGYPQASAIHEIYSEWGDDACIISDGGHNNTGDVVKALALGADFVMLGKLLSETKEVPKPGTYRGMASKAALEERKAEYFVEGVEVSKDNKHTVSGVLTEIRDAIKTAAYYLGASNLRDLRETYFIEVTANSIRENGIRK